MRGSGEGSSPVVVAAPCPVTSVTDFGGEVVDTRSLEVEREEECDLEWSDADSGGNSMGGSFLRKQRKWREGGVSGPDARSRRRKRGGG
jgi:hypothetical protein